MVTGFFPSFRSEPEAYIAMLPYLTLPYLIFLWALKVYGTSSSIYMIIFLKVISKVLFIVDLLYLISISLFIHVFTVFARQQALVQSSSSSRACSKRVMNQTMFDVPDPLVVHVLLLTHEFIYNVVIICLPHSWYPQYDRSMFFTCPKLR